MQDQAICKKVIVTGANGFIGKAVVRELNYRGLEVIPLVRTKTGLNGEIAIDFCDQNFYNAVYSLPKVDAIVHLGAKIGWTGETIQELFMPNVVATAVLADWAGRNGIYFIFASAAIVCGAKNHLISTTSMPSPDTDYGYSKFMAEEMVKMSGAKYAILRIGGVFGKDGPKHLGLNRAISEALDGKAPVVNGDGKIKRNYIFVKDLAAFIAICLEQEMEGTHFVASRNSNTIGGMVETICRLILGGKNPEYCESPCGQDQVVEPTPALTDEHSFEDAIKEIIKDEKRA